MKWRSWWPPENAELTLSDCERFYYDPEEGNRWVDWFSEYLVHVSGDMAGRPLVLLPYLQNFTRELMGWRCVKDDTRRYLTAFLYVPKKNAKTLWVAGLALGLIAIDGEPAAEVFQLAGTEEQARIGYKMAQDQIEGRPEMMAMFHSWRDYIEHPESNSVFRALTSSPKGKHGPSVHAAIFDEFHEFGDRELVRAMRKGMVARTSPLLLYTTTAGRDPEGPWWEEHEYATAVVKGDIDNPRYLADLYEPDPGDKPTDRKVWAKVNPGYGLSVNEQILEQIFREAEGRPSEEADFCRWHLNMRMTGAQEYIRTEEWEACLEDFTPESLKGEPCFGGLDLASVRDMNSLSLVFPKLLDGAIVYRLLLYYWVPRLTAKEKELAGYKYPKWIGDGLVRATEGNATDYRQIEADVEEILTEFDVQELAFDRMFANEMITNLTEKFKDVVFVAIPNTMTGIGPATKRFQELVLGKQVRHNGNAVLTWNVGNALVLKDNKENMMLSKSKSKGKIDGLAATINALSRAIHYVPKPKSVYQDRGLLII